mmetsp:Transcript_109154/g.284592  ORF Transcript_109154/g.284592 Transcript_109154/m.284592 type:complete len:100 (+) Transcript_109154:346-645(+)
MHVARCASRAAPVRGLGAQPTSSANMAEHALQAPMPTSAQTGGEGRRRGRRQGKKKQEEELPGVSGTSGDGAAGAVRTCARRRAGVGTLTLGLPAGAGR